MTILLIRTKYNFILKTHYVTSNTTTVTTVAENKDTVPPVSIDAIINNIGPWGLAAIGTILWLLKRK